MALVWHTCRVYLGLACCLLALAGCWKPERVDAQAREVAVVQGQASLQDMDGSLAFKPIGEWEYWPASLVTPGAEAGKNFAQVPGIWKGDGVGTYRVLLHHAPANLYLYLRHARSAYRLYANGKLVASNGVVSPLASEAKDVFKPTLAALGNQEGDVELLVQVSNYSHRTGGLPKPIILGKFEVLDAIRLNSSILDAFLLGALLLFGFYHLMLFVWHRDLASLIFWLCCCTIGLRALTMGEMLLMHWWPSLSASLLLRLEYTSMFSVILFLFYQHRLFPHIVPWKSFRWYGFFNLILLGSVWTLPSAAFTHLVMAWNASILVGMIWMLVMSLLGCLRKSPDSRLFFGSFLCVFAGTLNDVLNMFGLLNTFEMAPITMTMMLFFQSMVLSNQFSRALANAERLRREADMRKAQERELRRMRLRLQGMLDALPIAVAGLSEDGEFLYGNLEFRKGYQLPDDWFSSARHHSDALFPPLRPGVIQKGLRDETLSTHSMDLDEERILLVQVQWMPAGETHTSLTLTDALKLPARSAPRSDEPKRHLGVELMKLSLDCWTKLYGKDKFDLAERSGIWRIEMSADGWQRTRTLDRYLDEAELPSKPRWHNVERTAEFVLCYTEDDFEGKEELSRALQVFRET